MYDEKEYQPEQPSFKLDDLYEAKAYKWMLKMLTQEQVLMYSGV